MRLKYNTFAKIVTLLILLLIPIIVLYSLSIDRSMDVIKREIESLKQKDLGFLASEIDRSVDNLSTLSFLLSEDIHIRLLQDLRISSSSAYERNQEKLRIIERLRLLNVAERWDTQFTVMSPESGEMVSTNPYASFDLEALQQIVTPRWAYTAVQTPDGVQDRFIRHIVRPERQINNLAKAGIVVEASFPQDYLVKDLDTFKTGGKGDPFFYHPDGRVIANRTYNKELVAELAGWLQAAGMENRSSRTVSLAGSDYLVTAAEVRSLGWYVVDYVPLAETLQPIVESRNLFYGSVSLLLVMSVLAVYLLYRNVQRPIGLLIRGVQRLREGDYVMRIHADPKNEFTYLFRQFNEMAGDIQRLIGKVYAEEIRSREANLKQLQSQINPHFLYNCFALIRSLARLDKKEKVMSLAMHLSKYYRYTTRVEKPTATVQEELDLIRSYLEIQQFHVQHLSYELRVPESMLKLELPRLLLQPVVENAVLHGIERFDGDGMVTITGEMNDRYNTIIVADNGVGMSEEKLRQLERATGMPPTEDTGCALWNIRQRLILQFGAEAGISFDRGPAGGTAVQLIWPRNPGQEHKGM